VIVRERGGGGRGMAAAQAACCCAASGRVGARNTTRESGRQSRKLCMATAAAETRCERGLQGHRRVEGFCLCGAEGFRVEGHLL
jgi:hypothetical protein